MAELFSNQLKAVLVLDDITGDMVIRQKDCYTVQSFHYDCERTRDEFGNPYGPTNADLMEISIKSLSSGKEKKIYELLTDMELHVFSIVFNAVYDSDRRISDYADAMLVTGYVTAVEEEFDSADPSKDMMRLNISIMLHTLTFLGEFTDKVLVIND